MDALILIVAGLMFCLKSTKVTDADLVEGPAIRQEIVQLEKRVNTTYYEDEHAFEEVAHGLDFC